MTSKAAKNTKPTDGAGSPGLPSTAVAKPTRGQEAAVKAIKTAKTAMTLAKAHLARESKKHGGRWQWVEFSGPQGRESAGIVDILAIRKRWETTDLPGDEVLKHLDIFDIMLIQVKGGGAGMPTDQDIARMERVADLYRIDKILLYQWNVKKKAATGYYVLNRETHKFGLLVEDGKEIFGKQLPSSRTKS